jgi:hypothetical protein
MDNGRAYMEPDRQNGGAAAGGFDVLAWKSLPFFQKIQTADRPLRWMLVMPQLLGLYGFLLYALASSAVDDTAVPPLQALIGKDAFLLAELGLAVLGSLMAIACWAQMFRFRKSGISAMNAVFVVCALGNLLFLAVAVSQGAFISWALGASLILILLWGGSARYFKRRRHLFWPSAA